MHVSLASVRALPAVRMVDLMVAPEEVLAILEALVEYLVILFNPRTRLLFHPLMLRDRNPTNQDDESTDCASDDSMLELHVFSLI